MMLWFCSPLTIYNDLCFRHVIRYRGWGEAAQYSLGVVYQ